MGMLLRRETARATLLIGAVIAALPAQTFTTLVSFDGSDGANPHYMSLVQGTDGNFYGTTGAGGAVGDGTIFKITPAGSLTTLNSLTSSKADGGFPYAGLMLASNGDFYGTTETGGANGAYGTVFKITAAGTLTTLHSFAGPDGQNPHAALIQAANGNIYGTTYAGGASGYGTIFKITPGEVFSTVHSFDLTDGANPNAGLIQANDGNFFGTTLLGGANGLGTIFKITTAGSLTTLHSFDGTDGEDPYAGLIQASDGNFYGTTLAGGVTLDFGTVFKITPGGTLTTLHSFASTDGAYPNAALIQASDGNFYGTTEGGGAYGNYGTVFEITAEGTLTTLHSFDITDGEALEGGLVQGTGGSFYGSTFESGASFFGTIFNVSVGLGPFVRTVPTSGKVGLTVRILGTNLVGATSVTFNGTPATFTVVSPTLIAATVPTGATSGKVRVTTPSGALVTTVAFRVEP